MVKYLHSGAVRHWNGAQRYKALTSVSRERKTKQSCSATANLAGVGGGECCLASTNPELLTTVRKVRVITERRLELLAAATVHIHVIFLPHYWMFESTLLTIRSSTVKKQLRATSQYCCKTVGNRLKLRLKKE